MICKHILLITFLMSLSSFFLANSYKAPSIAIK